MKWKEMGLGRELFSFYAYLHEKGFFKEINSVIGRVVKIAIQKDDLIRKEDLV